MSNKSHKDTKHHRKYLKKFLSVKQFLANESDRLWVSLYDGFSRMSVPLFIIISAYLLVPMKEGQTMWQFYGRRFKRVLPPFIIFMVLYSTLPFLWGQIDKATALNDLARIPLNFPSLAGHLWFMYPLISLYLFIPVISHWLRRAPRIITGMSRLSFGVYLMHIFWLGVWVSLFKLQLALPTAAAIPCISVCTFISSFVTAKIIDFIPGSKWVIG